MRPSSDATDCSRGLINDDQCFIPGYSTRTVSTGFGLTIVREISEAHGWTVSVGESGGVVSDERGKTESRQISLSGARFEFDTVELT